MREDYTKRWLLELYKKIIHSTGSSRIFEYKIPFTTPIPSEEPEIGANEVQRLLFHYTADDIYSNLWQFFPEQTRAAVEYYSYQSLTDRLRLLQEALNRIEHLFEQKKPTIFDFVHLEAVSDPTWNARNSIKEVKDSRMMNDALMILDKLRYRIRENSNINMAQNISAFVSDDSSITIEWIFPNFRIGFGIEEDPKESGWYLVSDKSFGGINAEGYLAGINVDWLVKWMICLVTDSNLKNK